MTTPQLIFRPLVGSNPTFTKSADGVGNLQVGRVRPAEDATTAGWSATQEASCGPISLLGGQSAKRAGFESSFAHLIDRTGGVSFGDASLSAVSIMEI